MGGGGGGGGVAIPCHPNNDFTMAHIKLKANSDASL